MDDDLRPYLREHRGIILLALAALILVAFFFFPFLDGIILGTVFAYVAGPYATISGKGEGWAPFWP